MELGDLTLFNAIKKRLNWVTQRQEVLGQNIANADTPDFRARDLKAYKFKELVRLETMQINMDTTNSGHLVGQRKQLTDFFDDKASHAYETAPNGNSVVIEEQVSKLNETIIKHRLTTELYTKHLRMMRTALGR